MTQYDIFVIAAGIVMGLWLDRLLGPGQRVTGLVLGAGGLVMLLLVGQDWAGMALGCLLGSRLAPALSPPR